MRFCRVGTGDYSPAPLTEPDLWAHIRLLKLISLEQHELPLDLRGEAEGPATVHTTTRGGQRTKRSSRPCERRSYSSGARRCGYDKQSSKLVLGIRRGFVSDGTDGGTVSSGEQG